MFHDRPERFPHIYQYVFLFSPPPLLPARCLRSEGTRVAHPRHALRHGHHAGDAGHDRRPGADRRGRCGGSCRSSSSSSTRGATKAPTTDTATTIAATATTAASTNTTTAGTATATAATTTATADSGAGSSSLARGGGRDYIADRYAGDAGKCFFQKRPFFPALPA